MLPDHAIVVLTVGSLTHSGPGPVQRYCLETAQVAQHPECNNRRDRQVQVGQQQPPLRNHRRAEVEQQPQGGFSLPLDSLARESAQADIVRHNLTIVETNKWLLVLIPHVRFPLQDPHPQQEMFRLAHLLLPGSQIEQPLLQGQDSPQQVRPLVHSNRESCLRVGSMVMERRIQ